MTRAELLQKANELPLSPGVYLMKDKGGHIIYVGKSKLLKNRVTSYFQFSADHTPKTARMVANVCDFSYILTDSEMEALTLENSLIKLHAPKYNIRLKDDKNYPYIRIDLHKTYPTLSMVRKRSDDGARYFGPYSGTGAVFSIIRTLNRSFRLQSCRHEFPRDCGKVRPCIYAQIGQCCAPCTGGVSQNEYKELTDGVLQVLHGRFGALKEQLTKQMEHSAETLAFEAAAKYRDRIRSLEYLWQKQKVVAGQDADHDVFAVYSDSLCSVVSVFTVRGGVLTDHTAFRYGADSILEGENIPSFLLGYYAARDDIPREILTAQPLADDDARILSELLCEKAGRRVSIRTPQRGDGRALCVMAYENAKEQAALYARETEKSETVLLKLASMLTLEVVPQRIEAYDISNLGSEHITAGMVVFCDGKPKKSQYRTFRMETLSHADDYAAMEETIFRRMQHLRSNDTAFSEQPPDLILVDGGKGQVQAALAAMRRAGAFVPVYGMVKDDFHKTRTLTDGTHEIDIAKEQAVFSLIFRIQEEVHRYSVARMSGAKRKTLRRSSLTEIPGIGDSKAKRLLSHFGKLSALKAASISEIAAVGGISQKDANAVFSHYHKENGEEKR